MVRRRSLREQRDERGFTLIELMVVVAIVAILAAVAVPQFFKESKKVKTMSEVAAMFAEISTKQERFKQESNTYLAATECPPPTKNGTDVGTSPPACVGTQWNPMGIVPTESKIRCGYTVVTGAAGASPAAAFNVSGAAPTIVAPTLAPAVGWYVIHAKCDADGNGVYGYYVTSNIDSGIKKYKEGE